LGIRDEEDLVRESYDRVPYASASYHHTHPDHLATLALLNGVKSAPPERCRVLELGCSDGGNLVPMALELPESRFTGIDLSPRQIEAGRANVAELGITNVDLRVMSILDAGAELGTFDYIICHGVYSWVDRDVQEKILALCGQLLAPHGIAYVSYNTLPGGHLRAFVRDLLQQQTRGHEDAARAFELIAFLSDSTARDNDAWAQILRTTREQFEMWRDDPAYLLHDYFERSNEPLYFRDFMKRAFRQGLRYLGDAEPSMNEIDNLGPEVAGRLRALAAGMLEEEQYFDFLINRAFRRTLLCRDSVTPDRVLRLERMRVLHAASAAKPVSAKPDLKAGVAEGFENERGKSFSTSHPMAKATLVALAEAWPRAISFDELSTRIGMDDQATLTDLLWSFYWSDVIELHVAPPRCVSEVSARPRASELARKQAARGMMVTTQRRRVLKIDDPAARFVLQQLDGTRDRHDLLRLLHREATAGRLDITAGNQRVDTARIPMVLQAVLDHHLTRLARLALLVG
jgi:methyltransferase-like protein/2-polyprenyl-3-methyl-5-hydroxy-6-metoxy-1,4-benzoquinol methylase